MKNNPGGGKFRVYLESPELVGPAQQLKGETERFTRDPLKPSTGSIGGGGSEQSIGRLPDIEHV